MQVEWGYIRAVLIRSRRPIAYCSERINGSKSKYSTYVKKFYVIVRALLIGVIISKLDLLSYILTIELSNTSMVKQTEPQTSKISGVPPVIQLYLETQEWKGECGRRCPI